MTWIVRALAFLAAFYFAVLVVLWSLQSRFVYPAPQVAPPLTPGYQEIALKTDDGLTLRAFYRPPGAGMPTLVYFHGNGGTLRGASVSNGALVEAGVGALLVEYRGYGGNPGTPSEQGLYKDGEAALEWLHARGVSPAETIIAGNSIGGGVATEMAFRHNPAALILIAPFTSLPDAAKANLWWLPVDALMRDSYRNLEKVPRIKAPVLIQHGTADAVIPQLHGRRLAKAAQAGTFQSFDRAGHDLSFDVRSQQARRDWVLALKN